MQDHISPPPHCFLSLVQSPGQTYCKCGQCSKVTENWPRKVYYFWLQCSVHITAQPSKEEKVAERWMDCIFWRFALTGPESSLFEKQLCTAHFAPESKVGDPVQLPVLSHSECAFVNSKQQLKAVLLRRSTCFCRAFFFFFSQLIQHTTTKASVSENH